MIRNRVYTDTSIIQRNIEVAQRAPQRMRTLVNREIKKVRPLILKDLRVTPPQSPLPFVWSRDPIANLRARRWYFANKVRGRAGGRYRRTGKMGKAWRVEGSFRDTGGNLIITNKARGAVFVHGYRQVPSHTRTKWPRLTTVARRWGRRMAKRYEEIWREVTHGG